MGVSNLWFLHGVLLPSATFLSELTDLSPTSGIDELVGRASGHPDPLFLAARKINPGIAFESPSVAQVLTACGATFAADLSGGNTDLHYKKGANLGVRLADATAGHQRFRMASGMMFWEEISATHQQDAVIRARIIPTYNGSVAPIVPAGGLALAGTAAAGSFYTLGPIFINGTELNGIESMRLTLGAQVMELSSGGDVYTTFAGIGQREPVLEITSLETGAWVTYGLNGTALNGSSGVVAYLRTKTADGTNAVTGCISLTALYGRVEVSQTAGSGNGPAKTTLRIPLRANSAAAAVLAYDTNASLP